MRGGVRDALLVLPAGVTFIYPMLAYPLSSVIGVVAGVGTWIFGKKVWGKNQVLEWMVVLWVALGIVAALMNSAYIAAASVGFLISGFMAYAAVDGFNGSWAAVAFILPYLSGSGAAECVRRGIPLSKYLPFMLMPAQGAWIPPTLPVRAIFSAVAGYYVAEYVMKNMKVSKISYALITLSIIYTATSLLAISLSPYELSTYIAALAVLMPILMWVFILKAGRL